ncbi:MAG: AEC family transporter [Rhodospirillales bacterium]|nr:AEC family transporter [Rhodospirillales bacterium]
MTVLTVTLPLFALVLAGFMAFRKSLLSADGVRGIANFAFFVALPVLMFKLMSELNFGNGFNGRFFLHWTGAGLVSYVLGMAVSRFLFGSSLSGQSIHGMSASFGNMAIIGLPIIIDVFGPTATLPITIIVAVDAIILMPITIVVLEIIKSGAARGTYSLAPALWKGISAVARNPLLLGLALGGAAGFTEISPPSALQKFIDLTGAAGIPCALFALGGSLAQRNGTQRMGEAITMIVQKLWIYPVIMFLSLSFIPDLDPVWWATGILAASMPMGANLYLIAEAYGAHVGRASLSVLVSTALSLISVTLLASHLAQHIEV